MNIVISSGHGLKVSGAVGIINEVTEARKVAAKTAEFLRLAGIGVKEFNDDTSITQQINLKTIVGFHNAQTRDMDVSVHFNASRLTNAPMGCEVLYVSAKGQEIAQKLSGAIAKAGGLKNRGPKKRSDLAFLNGTSKPAVLIEVCFVDSSADVALYRENFDAICRAIAEALSGKSIEEPMDTSNLTAIMGAPMATAAKMKAYIKKKNPNAPDLVDIYLAVGAAEGVRGDLMFAQSCLETGNFLYEGSAVTPDQHNYCGMGVTQNGIKGNSFSDARTGILAQGQHLRAYADTNPLKLGCVDPRFNFVTPRGCAPYIEWLGIQENPQKKGWAGGKDYGAKILRIYEEILKMEAEERTPEEITVDNAIADGIITDRVHWVGVLTGSIKPNSANIKILMDNTHRKLNA